MYSFLFLVTHRNYYYTSYTEEEYIKGETKAKYICLPHINGDKDGAAIDTSNLKNGEVGDTTIKKVSTSKRKVTTKGQLRTSVKKACKKKKPVTTKTSSLTKGR